MSRRRCRILLAFALSSMLAGCAVTNDSSERVAPVDFVVVDKSDRVLVLFDRGRPIRSYRIALGREPIGPKRYEGDGRTPEGLYVIDGRNPNSRFHLSLHLSYPSAADAAAADTLGLDPGRDIMIHGLPNGISAAAAAAHPLRDWTDGCIALTNSEIAEVWALVADGTPILIQP